MKKSIRIANAGGFWGDDLDAFRRQIEGGEIDYLTLDFLAEITMSILKKQQLKRPDLGYVPDFVEQVLQMASQIKEKKIRILSNAGGINPRACGQKIMEGLAEQGINLTVAVIDGDDISGRLDAFYPQLAAFTNLETGQSFEPVKDKIQSANVYLGLPPLLAALKAGADIIIAGRVTDTSITMAPMVYEFGWKLNDWDKLAAGVVAGHIIECGGQTSGGNFSDWHKVQHWLNFGFPIVEMSPDGSFIITKHPNSGGIVSPDTVREQLLYEMGNPAEYISPDVVADFRTIRLEEAGENRVRVWGIKGGPSTPFFKVSMAYSDGYKSSGSIIISGPRSREKAEVFKSMFWKRLNTSFVKSNTEYIGYNSCTPGANAAGEPNEILLRFLVYDYDKKKLDHFAKNIAPLILTGPPGVAVTGGRPRAQEVMAYWPALIPKQSIQAEVSLVEASGSVKMVTTVNSVTGFEKASEQAIVSQVQVSSEEVRLFKPVNKAGIVEVPLYDICLARSGDKGDTANIGVIARSEKIYKWICDNLTSGVVKSIFSEVCQGKVVRYEVPNLQGLNFLLEQSLDGGGTRSLKIDAQGKTFAQTLLNCRVWIPEEILDKKKNY